MNRKELLGFFRYTNPTKCIIDAKHFDYIVTDGEISRPNLAMRKDKVFMCDKDVPYRLTNKKPSYEENYHYIGLD